MTLGVWLGLIGAGLTLLSFLMKDMLRLRAIALLSNLAFFAYGLLEAQLPSIILNAVLIPLNTLRVLEIRHILQALKISKVDSPVSEWLLPNMSRREVKAGTVLFRQGDHADEMLYIESGKIRLLEIDKVLGEGSLIGEIGLFSPQGTRTLGARCETDCSLYTLSRDEVRRLSYTQPQLTFYLVQLIVGRLVEKNGIEAERLQPPEQAKQG